MHKNTKKIYRNTVFTNQNIMIKIRKLIYLCLFFFLSLCAEEITSSVNTIVAGEPSANVMGSINAITGDYFIAQRDLIVKGIEPIILEHFYSSGVKEWDLFGHLYLEERPMKTVVVKDPAGGQHSYLGCDKRKSWRIYKKNGLTNIGTGKISARTNLTNQYLTRLDGNYILHCSNGTKKLYARKKKTLEGSFKLFREDFPNGNHCYYEYDGKDRVIKIYTTNPDSSKIYAEIQVTYENTDNFRIRASDGKIIDFHFEKNNLVEIATNFGYRETFEYAKEHGHRLHKRHKPLMRMDQIDYHDKNPSDIHGERVKIHNNKDAPYGRVRRLYRSGIAHRSIEERLSATYAYHGKKYKDSTSIFDPYGKKTLYSYTDEKRPLSIRELTKAGEKGLESHFEWNEILLNSKKILNSKGEEIWKRRFQYDKKGNVLKELISIQGQETSVTEHVYNEQSLPILSVYPSGRRDSFTYFKNTDLVQQKDSGEEVLKFEYNQDHLLSETIHCSNGIGLFKKIVRRESAPAIGFPHTVLEGYYDGKTPVVLKKREFFYDKHSSPILEKIYDAKDNLLYTIEKTFDIQGNITSETNALGQRATYRYNPFGEKIEECNFAGLCTKYTYDLAGRCTLEEIKGNDGSYKQKIYSYDLADRKISSTDEFGNTTYFEYNLLGFLSKTIKPDGSFLLHGRDSAGNEISFTDENGHVTLKHFNGEGKTTEIIHPNGAKEKLFYYPDGNLKKHIDPEGIVTEYSYNYLGSVTSKQIKDLKGDLLSKESFVYEGPYLIAYTDPNNITTHYCYNKAGRKISEEKNGDLTTFTYDFLGRLYKKRTLDVVNVTEYDLLNRTISESIENTEGVVLSSVSYIYDSAGNVHQTIRHVQGKPSVETVFFDGLNRPIKKVDPLGQITYTYYDEDYMDKEGRRVLKISTLDATSGIVSIDIHDVAGRISISKKESPSGTPLAEEEYFFDKAGNRIRQESTVYKKETLWKKTTLFSFSETNALLSFTECADTHEARTTRFEYSRRKEKTAIIKPDGSRTEMRYDGLSRLIEMANTDETIRYSYDAMGNTIKIESSSGITERVYDHRGCRIKEKLENGLVLEKKFDALSRPIEVRYPDGAFACYNYSSFYLRMITRFDKEGKALYRHHYLDYDLTGNLLSEEGVFGKISYTYDALSRPISIVTDHFSQENQTFDSRGNILSFDLNGKPQNFAYNGLDQLEEEPEHTYLYDSHHNRLEKDKIPQTVDSLNQLLSDGDKSYSYDERGNQIKHGDMELTYDAQDRLTFVETTTKNVRYSYDPLGRRMSKEVIEKGKLYKEYYLYDSQDEVGSYDAQGLAQSMRILGLGKGAEMGAAISIELEGILYFPIHDLQGNVSLIQKDQAIYESYYYTAFGEESVYNGWGLPAFTIENPWRFRSKRCDPETGFIFFGRRYYDPKIGRWLTPDPAGLDEGPNLYAFLLNNPLGRRDLYGLFIEDQNFGDYKNYILLSFERAATSSSMNVQTFDISCTQEPPPYIEGKHIKFGAVYFVPGINNNQHDILSNAEHLQKIGKEQFPVQALGVISQGADIDAISINHLNKDPMHMDIYTTKMQYDINNLSDKVGPDGKILIFAMSGGASITYNALYSLPESVLQKLIVVTVTPAKIIPKSLVKESFNYIGKWDFITKISDPKGYKKSLVDPDFAHNKECERVPGAPLWDHNFQSPSYKEHIEDHIIDFKEKYYVYPQ